MNYCYWCQRLATHFCSACGKWICSSPICKGKSIALAALNATGVVKHGNAATAELCDSGRRVA